MKINSNVFSALILLTAFIYLLMVTFNALGGIGYKGLFNQSVGYVSDKYQVYITPAGWTFSIWSFIYIFLGAGAIYCVTTIFRKSGIPYNSPVFLTPAILNWAFYSTLLFNYALNTAWIFIWNYEYIVAATIFLLFIAYSGWIAFAVACYRAKKALANELEERNTKQSAFKEVKIQRILIHNGIAFYTTWTTIASLLNINIAFQYFGHFDPETISVVCLSCLLAILVGWFVLENAVLDKYVRYTMSQYPVVIVATAGILSKQLSANRLDGPVPNSVYSLTIACLVIAIIQLLAKVGIVIYRHLYQPLFNEDMPVLQVKPQTIKN